MTEKAALVRDYLISVADLRAWEQENGALQEGVIVLINTGSAKLWPDATAYMGTAERGEAAVASLHFPGIHLELATFLAEQHNVKAVGIDTPSIDYGQSADFLTHRILFAANIPGFENIAAVKQLPAIGAFVVALPMKIHGGSGGPLKIIGSPATERTRRYSHQDPGSENCEPARRRRPLSKTSRLFFAAAGRTRHPLRWLLC